MKTKALLLLLGATVAFSPSLGRAQTSQSKAVPPVAIWGTPIGVGANGAPLSALDVSFKPADFAWLDNDFWSYSPFMVVQNIALMGVDKECNYSTMEEAREKNIFFRWQKQFEEIGEAEKKLMESGDVNRPEQTKAKRNELRYREAFIAAKALNRIILNMTANLDDNGRFSKTKLAPYELWASDNLNSELAKVTAKQKKSPENLAKIRFVNRILLERMLMQSRWNTSLEGYADYVELSPFEKKISVRKP